MPVNVLFCTLIAHVQPDRAPLLLLEEENLRGDRKFKIGKHSTNDCNLKVTCLRLRLKYGATQGCEDEA